MASHKRSPVGSTRALAALSFLVMAATAFALPIAMAGPDVEKMAPPPPQQPQAPTAPPAQAPSDIVSIDSSDGSVRTPSTDPTESFVDESSADLQVAAERGPVMPRADRSRPEQMPELPSAPTEGLREFLAKLQGSAGSQIDSSLTTLDENVVEPARDTAEGLAPIPGLTEDATPPTETAPQTGAAVTPAHSGDTVLIVGSILVAGATAAGAAFFVWIGSTGTAGAAAGAASSGASGATLRKLLPFASPLFTRFEKDTVLGHPKREQLYGLIMQRPGVSLQMLCEQTGLSRTAVTHHLRLLEQQHLIVSKRMGRNRHYYENGGRFAHEQKAAYALLQNPRSRTVAEFIRDHPGTNQKDLCAALSLQPSIAHWHVRRLSSGGLVEAVREGREVRYFNGVAMQATAPVAAATAAAPMAVTA